jgi:hypothetical protein
LPIKTEPVSDPHGHYDIAVKLFRTVLAWLRAYFRGAVWILEREPDLLFGDRAQELE